MFLLSYFNYKRKPKVDAYTNLPAEDDEILYSTHKKCYAFAGNVIMLLNSYFENKQKFSNMWLNPNAQSMDYIEFCFYINKIKFVAVCAMCSHNKGIRELIDIEKLMNKIPEYDKNKLVELRKFIIKEWTKKKYDMIDCIKCSALARNTILNTYQCQNKQCNHKFCNVCKESCNDNIYDHNNINCLMTKNVNDLYILSNSVPCPGCKLLAQRISGCNHMTCARCNAYFCYDCGGYTDTKKCESNRCNNHDARDKRQQYLNLVRSAINISQQNISRQ